MLTKTAYGFQRMSGECTLPLLSTSVLLPLRYSLDRHSEDADDALRPYAIHIDELRETLERLRRVLGK
jgi:hypothetical protein